MKGVQIGLDEVDEGYKAFVDKFKPKKTTDDCYTPPLIFEAVEKWVRAHYPVGEIVRPFWPGGDYERHEYPEGCTVLDNPPFSILSRIINFYNENGIRYFLFAPHLTNFNYGLKCCHIITDAQITYENGAQVNTSFVTNLDDRLVIGDPEFFRILKESNDENLRDQKKQLPKYVYPDNVVMATDVSYMVRHGVSFELAKDEAVLVRALESQKANGKTMFGGGFLVSDAAAIRKAAAKKAAAEKAEIYVWSLSERERMIIDSMAKLP